jgi:uncharacterized membrane protein YphA (DoxX/SURF4 family)
MKALVFISRILVGGLFIFSGIIKLNDPVGFSFKLEDYFAPDVLNLGFLVPYALAIAIFVVIYEVLLGVMVIIGYARKFTVWSLLLMIVFFTFLTFYSAYFNKVTDCGCFGDAIKLTPWESFTKDLILLVFILILYFGQKHITPLFAKASLKYVVLATFLFCVFITYQVLNHLPYIDFRAYKIGSNIQESMSIPPDAPRAIYDYSWKFDVNGEEKIVVTQGDYPAVDGEFVGVDTKLVQEGYTPPITDFTIETEDEILTDEILAIENLIMVVVYNVERSNPKGFANIKKITDEAIEKGYTVIGLSASLAENLETLKTTYQLNFDFYFCDQTVLKTIVRSNPGILELNAGTIKQKLHWNDALKLELKTIEPKPIVFDEQLKSQLDSIKELDQRYRSLMGLGPTDLKIKAEEMGLEEDEYSGDLWSRQRAIDQSNMDFMENIFNTKGYPGRTMVGEQTSTTGWYVLQHSDKIPKYFPIIKKAGEEGELPYRFVAMMEDRLLMQEGKPQIYGTQGKSYDDARGSFIWPIENPESVNERRMEAGFTSTIEEYGKNLFGSDFEYKVLTMDDVTVD